MASIFFSNRKSAGAHPTGETGALYIKGRPTARRPGPWYHSMRPAGFGSRPQVLGNRAKKWLFPYPFFGKIKRIG